MEFEFKKNEIVFNRELSNLDKLVLKFVKVLDSQKIDYVIISGYVAILFGRSRNTEDIDLFIEEMSFEKFSSLWESINETGFECINEFTPKRGYYEYLQNKTALRFAEKGTFLPNFELKFPHSKINFYSLKNKVCVLLNNENVNISELELQIAFKLKLGSEKDFEDCRHLYNVFKEHLNISLLKKHISELKVENETERILWKKD